MLETATPEIDPACDTGELSDSPLDGVFNLLTDSGCEHPVEGTDSETLRNEVTTLFSRLRPEIKSLINRYLDRRLRARVDASDVAQAAYIDVHDRLARYLAERPMKIRPWLFFLAKMKTLETNQHHLASKKRAIKFEEHRSGELESRQDDATSPSQALSRKEIQQKLLAAIDTLPEHYRSIIESRHLKGMSNQAVAQMLELSENAASKLYVRAINALQRAMVEL